MLIRAGKPILYASDYGQSSGGVYFFTIMAMYGQMNGVFYFGMLWVNFAQCRRGFMKWICLIALVPVFMVGCQPEASRETSDGGAVSRPAEGVNSEASSEQAEALTDELLAMAQDPDNRAQEANAYIVTDKLALTGPTALAPLLDLLDQPESSGDTKLFVLRCVHARMTPAYLPQLRALLESKKPVTRSCAAQLIGAIHSDESVEILKELYRGDDSHVAFSALSGLAQQVGDPYRNELSEMYFAEGTSEAKKTEVVRVIIMNPKPEDVKILESVIVSDSAGPNMRNIAAMWVAQHGDLDSITVLEKSIELDGREEYRQMVEAGIAAIRERNEA